MSDETCVIVPYPKSAHIDLRERGIDKKQAANLRSRLSTFAKGWDSPEMNIYNNYDEAKTHIKTR